MKQISVIGKEIEKNGQQPCKLLVTNLDDDLGGHSQFKFTMLCRWVGGQKPGKFININSIKIVR